MYLLRTYLSVLLIRLSAVPMAFTAVPTAVAVTSPTRRVTVAVPPDLRSASCLPGGRVAGQACRREAGPVASERSSVRTRSPSASVTRPVAS